jgi:predicted ester cyclase
MSNSRAADGVQALGVLERFVDAYNTGDIDVLLGRCGEAYTWHGFADGRPIELDRAGFAASVTEFWSAFPDARLEILDTIAQGDRVSVRLRETGHHTGERWSGFAADGARVVWYPTIIYRIEGDKVVEEWSAPITFEREGETPVEAASGSPDAGTLAGRHALVTGGSRGIGLAIAGALIGQGAEGPRSQPRWATRPRGECSMSLIQLVGQASPRITGSSRSRSW